MIEIWEENEVIEVERKYMYLLERRLVQLYCGFWNGFYIWFCGKEVSGELRLIGNQLLIREEFEKFVKWFVFFIIGDEKLLKYFKQGVVYYIFLDFSSKVIIGWRK